LSEYPNLEEVEIDGKYFDIAIGSGSGLNKLKVNNCPKLTGLFCFRNKLTSLTLNCSALVKLDLQHNSLTNLDVSNCPVLQEIICL